jgi:hypothetical protein
VSLRGAPVNETATLPDGRTVEVFVGVPVAREIVGGLAGGTLEPTAGAIEPLADELR